MGGSGEYWSHFEKLFYDDFVGIVILHVGPSEEDGRMPAGPVDLLPLFAPWVPYTPYFHCINIVRYAEFFL